MAQPTFSIPQDVITPIIQAQITAAVAQAMGPQARVMEQAVAGILSTKVDERGTPGNYSSNKPWIEWAVGEAIRAAAKAAIEQFVAEQQEAIKAALVKDLSKKNSPLLKSLMDGMISGVFRADNLKYRLNIEVI